MLLTFTKRQADVMIILLYYRYDPLSSCLVDFKGRANMGSVKNFQIIESSPQDTTAFAPAKASGSGSGGAASSLGDKEFILQMGKVLFPF